MSRIVVLQPRLAVLIACVLGIGWAVLQARLEEVDLAGRRYQRARAP